MKAGQARPADAKALAGKHSHLGPVVKWYNAAFALRSRESDSPQVHQTRNCKRGDCPLLAISCLVVYS